MTSILTNYMTVLEKKEFEEKNALDKDALSKTLSQNIENNIIGSISDIRYKNAGRISIKPFGDFDFKPREVKTMRDDIFREGFFSVFDVLVHLHEKGKIDLVYHFDEEMNTHVVDSINGETDYWYMAYYDGGWPENNIFRITGQASIFTVADTMSSRTTRSR